VQTCALPICSSAIQPMLESLSRVLIPFLLVSTAGCQRSLPPDPFRLHLGGEVEEFYLNTESLCQMATEGLHADRLRGVMAGKDNVHGMIAGRPVVGMGGLAGNQGVGSHGSRFAGMASGTAGDDRHTLRPIRPVGQDDR